ncbi:UTRA domain-containing protein [Celerinatantimonas diazotrophica]|uniref:GntR family transcriptional regulator n=1 Tax=Celerinatantimonas diazotrophica TaxID=412034 RepID=A0A4R1K7Q8_9GAMM|nr:UTRA domain-containing protein [Celerinatantimonas diazotrophica]TCK59099.1 GntR family transcriptional regulator [Celerinatantimonas diazotrophica]CAG9297737.1 Putative transcriptional regulator of 2-aminoethylphosphonate degradation operons [Celerinatantimonas diazotrophica]
MQDKASRIRKIRSQLRGQLAQEVFKPGSKLPSERTLSELFNVSRMTIKDALESLQSEGLIYCEDRRGWFVAHPRLIYNPLSRMHFHRLVNEQRRKARTQVLDVSSELASPDLMRVMELAELTRIYRIQRCRFIDDRPVLLVENCLNSQYFPDILNEDLSQSLTELYQRHYGYENSRSRFDVQPCAAPENVAQALHLASGQMVLKIIRVNYNRANQLIDCEFEYWRHDAVCIRIDSQSID